MSKLFAPGWCILYRIMHKLSDSRIKVKNIINGNHANNEKPYLIQCIAESKNPAVQVKHNLKSMCRQKVALKLGIMRNCD